MEKTENRLKDLLITSFVALILFVLCIKVNLGFFAIGIFAIPALYTYLTAKHDIILGAIGVAIFGIVACFLTGVPVGLLITLALVPWSLFLGYALHKKTELYKSFALSLIGVILGVMIMVFVIPAVYGSTLNELIVKGLEEAMRVDEQGTRLMYVMSNYMLSGVADLKTLTDTTLNVNFMIKAVVRNYREILALIMPNLLSSVCAFFGIINVIICGNILKKQKPPKYDMKPFADLAIPSHFGTFLIVFLFISWIGVIMNLSNFSVVSSIVNGFTTVIFSLQGMALIDWLLKKKIDITAVRWVIIIVTFVLLYVINIYMWIGIFEQIIKIRQRNLQQED